MWSWVAYLRDRAQRAEAALASELKAHPEQGSTGAAGVRVAESAVSVDTLTARLEEFRALLQVRHTALCNMLGDVSLTDTCPVLLSATPQTAQNDARRAQEEADEEQRRLETSRAERLKRHTEVAAKARATTVNASQLVARATTRVLSLEHKLSALMAESRMTSSGRGRIVVAAAVKSLELVRTMAGYVIVCYKGMRGCARALD